VTAEVPRSVGVGEKLLRRIVLRASREKRDGIYNAALDSSYIDIEYAALLILASLIALFGLLENSAAVIIGAMLISPLMNPILSAALALLLGDGNLGKRSVVVLGLSTAGAVGITWLVASLTPLTQATPEILARTTPNLLDLFIALLSGLAGTLALRGGSVAMTILPGVAIAVAVVPPLSVVGYGLSTHQGSVAGGAFLLFITNLVAIIISAVAMFRVIGFRPLREAEHGRWKFKYRVGISVIVLVLLSIPLFLTLREAAIQVTTRSELQRELNSAFAADKASVSDLTFSRLRDGLLIQATLRTSHYVETDAILSVEDVLRKRFGSGTDLRIEQILVAQGGVTATPPVRAQNPILGGVVKPVEQSIPSNFKSSSAESLQFVQNDVDSILAGTAIRREGAPEINFGPGAPLVVRLGLTSPQPMADQTISLLASQIGSKLGLPVQLHGQVELLDPSFQLALTPAKSTLALSTKDRAALGKIIGKVQQGNLRLQITCTSSQSAAGANTTPPYVSELQRFLSHSRLKSSQWAIGVQPPGETNSTVAGGIAAAPAGTQGNGAPPGVAGQFRCDVKSIQDF
jgi:uncharacterized hydrophobic protein (TIGR00271 family)